MKSTHKKIRNTISDEIEDLLNHQIINDKSRHKILQKVSNGLHILYQIYWNLFENIV